MDLKAAGRRAGRLLAGDDTAEQAGVFASALMVGTSFGAGLLPRPGPDQALATGIVAAANQPPVTDNELLAIEHALRRREAAWAQRRLVAEQLRRAKEAVQRQTKTWGVAPDGAMTPDPGTTGQRTGR